MKPQYRFYFVDEPQYATLTSRAHMANYLRAYRRQPRKYKTTHAVTRDGQHAYDVTLVGSTAHARFERI